MGEEQPGSGLRPGVIFVAMCVRTDGELSAQPVGDHRPASVYGFSVSWFKSKLLPLILHPKEVFFSI